MSNTIYPALTFATNTEDTSRVAAAPTNPYMDTWKSGTQKEVLHSLTGESIHKNGQEMIYLVRELQNVDLIFGEDPTNSFADSYRFAIYLATTEYTGDEEFNSQGLHYSHGLEGIVEPKLFQYQVPGLTEPRAGDLIYWPIKDTLYEITWVDDDDSGAPILMNGALPQRKLSLRKFIYSGEKINTFNNSIYDNVDPLSLVEDVAWTRVGSTITVSSALHELVATDALHVVVTSDALALPTGDETVVSVTDINTFVLTGLNAGATSGTMSYYPNPNGVQFTFPAIDMLDGKADDHNSPNEATQIQTTSDASITSVIDEMNPFNITI